MKNDTINHQMNPIAMDQNNSSFIARMSNQMIVVNLVRNIGMNLSAMLCWKLSTTESHLSS